MRRVNLVLVAGVLSLLLSSCMLAEGRDYVVQPAPPAGVHITIRSASSTKLKGVSDLVVVGHAIDADIRAAGYDVSCDFYESTRCNGDRCAFRILRAIEISGSLAEGAAKRLYWNDAVAWDEFDDFRRDSMDPVRAHPDPCLHVTVQNRGDWPLEWRDSNWTWRSTTAPNC